MNRSRELATRLLILRVLRDRLAAADTAAREEARAVFDRPGVRDIGLAGDEQIGHVRLDKATTTATLTDEAAHLAWCQEHAPEAVETVVRVRNDVVMRHLRSMREYGAVADEATGEMVAVPGIRVADGDPRLVVLPLKDADAVVAGAVARGELSFVDIVRALPGAYTLGPDALVEAVDQP